MAHDDGFRWRVGPAGPWQQNGGPVPGQAQGPGRAGPPNFPPPGRGQNPNPGNPPLLPPAGPWPATPPYPLPQQGGPGFDGPPQGVDFNTSTYQDFGNFFSTWNGQNNWQNIGLDSRGQWGYHCPRRGWCQIPPGMLRMVCGRYQIYCCKRRCWINIANPCRYQNIQWGTHQAQQQAVFYPQPYPWPYPRSAWG